SRTGWTATSRGSSCTSALRAGRALRSVRLACLRASPTGTAPTAPSDRAIKSRVQRVRDAVRIARSQRGPRDAFLLGRPKIMRTTSTDRRDFLSNVGRGMLVAGIGFSVAQDLGLAPALAEEAPAERLTFGARERLVAMMQETPPDRLLPQLVELHRRGTDLRELVAAGALANARAFGGEDYIGFHTFMALMP